MIIYCREHAQPMGDVRLVSGGPILEIRRHHWQDRFADKIGIPGRANEWYTLDRTGRDVPARCPDCSPRMLEVAVILRAFEEGDRKLHL